MSEMNEEEHYTVRDVIVLYHELNLDKYSISDDYFRGGRHCLFDPIREMLVVKTPEEIVRQKFICYLQDKMNIPKQMIQVEVPLSRFKKGAKGRADIVVFGITNDEEQVPVIVVECKAPSVPLTYYTTEQATNYDNVLSANTIITTNGNRFAIMNKKESVYKSLASIPSYEQIIKQNRLLFIENDEDNWERPAFKEIGEQDTIDCFIENGWISEVTDERLYPFLVNLTGFIQCDKTRLNKQILRNIKIIEDGGIRYFSFGNAAGGNWPGYYRFFILEDVEGNNQIVSVSVLAAASHVDDPKFGNRSGHTTLVVAIDDFDTRHNSLQLKLDKYILETPQEFQIYHDGTLTAGKGGAVKRSDVIDYINIHAPELLDENRNILLGKFKKAKEINWNDQESTDFIGRLIKYALVRDQFRRTRK